MADAERWSRVGALFDRALASPSDGRDALIRASGEPEDIQNEVRSLLAAHDEADDFLSQPPPELRDAVEAAGDSAPHDRFSETVTRLEPPALTEGTAIGPYRIVRLIGRGGMGVVYEARDPRLHRTVALKLLSPELARDEKQRQRLRHEARAAAALTHPGIATIFALEEYDGQILIVSECLPGETLRAEIDRGRLPRERAMATAREIASALAAAHARGIVHRDLKPENIIRTASGAVKILDFGLAQFEPGARELASLSRLTAPGLVAGTPPYMAPEQLLGHSTDFRTDQFAFGVVFYELLTGTHPFGGHSLPSTIARILASDPPPPAQPADFPDGVWELISRCLAKDPANRFETTDALVAALRDAGSGTLAPASGELAAPSKSSGDVPAGIAAAATEQSSAFWWWKFHQIAAAVVYWAMVWPAWHVHRGIGAGGLFFFFATLAAVVVSANLRLHLWFSARIYPSELASQRTDVQQWIRWGDVAFVSILVTGGLLLPEQMAGWAALLISVGIGTAVAFLVIEPATARAAFRRGSSGVSAD